MTNWSLTHKNNHYLTYCCSSALIKETQRGNLILKVAMQGRDHFRMSLYRRNENRDQQLFRYTNGYVTCKIITFRLEMYMKSEYTHFSSSSFHSQTNSSEVRLSSFHVKVFMPLQIFLQLFKVFINRRSTLLVNLNLPRFTMQIFLLSFHILTFFIFLFTVL